MGKKIYRITCLEGSSLRREDAFQLRANLAVGSDDSTESGQGYFQTGLQVAQNDGNAHVQETPKIDTRLSARSVWMYAVPFSNLNAFVL